MGKGFRHNFIFITQKKLLCARIQTTRKDEKFGARMAQSAEKVADVGFRNQKWTPERALFNDTNESFQLGRTAEKIDLQKTVLHLFLIT